MFDGVDLPNPFRQEFPVELGPGEVAQVEQRHPGLRTGGNRPQRHITEGCRNVMLPEPCSFLRYPLRQASKVVLAGFGQSGHVHQQGAGLQNQADVGVLCPITDASQLLGGEQLLQVGPCEIQVLCAADQIHKALCPPHCLCDDRQVPGDVAEAVVGQIETEIAGFHLRRSSWPFPAWPAHGRARP